MRTILEQNGHVAGNNPLSHEEILTLIRGIEQGKSSALLSLYNATNRLVFGLTLRILGERSSAEVTLLDVYTQIWNQSVRYDPAMPPVEWLIAAVHRIASARLHWTKRERAKVNPSPETVESSMTVAPEPQQTAREAMLSLDLAKRELLVRAYYGGLSCNEMAAQIGKPVGAVRAHIRSGLNKLGEASLQKPASRMEADAHDGGIR
jgi:RNA polymerase sigma-70 factor (ECF subfamily)